MVALKSLKVGNSFTAGKSELFTYFLLKQERSSLGTKQTYRSFSCFTENIHPIIHLLQMIELEKLFRFDPEPTSRMKKEEEEVVSDLKKSRYRKKDIFPLPEL